MEKVVIEKIKKKLYKPAADSHKGQNGKLLIIGGSELFHAASLWAAEMASKIVDMVYYSSVDENNEIFLSLKKKFRNGIVVARRDLEDYVSEADCILVGPGMVRSESRENMKIKRLEDLEKAKDEGVQTRALTEYLLSKYPSKRWVLDAGALQMMEAEWLKEVGSVIVTPHEKEFIRLFGASKLELGGLEEKIKVVEEKAKEFDCCVLLKGEEDVISDGKEVFVVEGGNSGMTKGGTGDVLAGLVAGLSCKNDLVLAARVGSWVNKTAGERLFEKVGTYFNASDLLTEVPKVLAELTKIDY